MLATTSTVSNSFPPGLANTETGAIPIRTGIDTKSPRHSDAPVFSLGDLAGGSLLRMEDIQQLKVHVEKGGASNFPALPTKMSGRFSSMIDSSLDMSVILKPRKDSFSLSQAVRESLSDLAEVDAYATEIGLAPLDDSVKESADRILREIGRTFPFRYEVYPIVGGKIVIHAQERKGHSVLVICAPNGSASCLVTKDEQGRRAHYDSAADLPDSFVRHALGEVSASPQ